MSKTLWVSSFVASACLVTASLAAQAPSTPAPITPAPSIQVPSTEAPATPAPRAAATASKKITLSGCVARQAEGLSASAGAPSMPFTLTNAAAVGAGGPVGTAGASASAPVAKTYRLDAAESMISPHVGHKVEITGTVEDQPAPASAATAVGASAVAAPKLKAESVKMLAATCQ